MIVTAPSSNTCASTSVTGEPSSWVKRNDGVTAASASMLAIAGCVCGSALIASRSRRSVSGGRSRRRPC